MIDERDVRCLQNGVHRHDLEHVFFIIERLVLSVPFVVGKDLILFLECFGQVFYTIFTREILPRNDHRLASCIDRGLQFHINAAYTGDTTVCVDFTSHGHVSTDFHLGQSRSQGQGYGSTCRRPVLGRRPSHEVEMNRGVRLVEAYAQLISAVKNCRSSHLSALIHNTLDVPRSMNHAEVDLLAFLCRVESHGGGLNGHHGSYSHLHIDSQPHHLSDSVLFVDCPRWGGWLEVFFHLLSGDVNRSSPEGEDLLAHDTEEQGTYNPLQLTDSCFMGVVLDQVAQNLCLFPGIDRNLVPGNLVPFTDPLDEMFSGYFHFFLQAVPVQQHELATIHHRRRHGLQRVGRQDKVEVR